MRDEETREDFTRLFNEHSHAVMRFTVRRLADVRSCEEVVADTFLVAWRKWDDLPPRDRELRWLYGIAFRVLSNKRRSRDRRGRLFTRLSLERDPQSLNKEEEDFDFLRRALTKLRTSDRELLEFVYWEEFTYREIADVVGASENAVGIRINRAKTNLKALLSSSQNESPNLNNFGREFES